MDTGAHELQKRCKYCSEQILESARICRYCNRDQFHDEQRERERQEDELIAAIDQFDLSRAVSLLPQAQQAAYQSEVDRQKKSTGIAYLFFILLGCFGAHKFYCRERDWGFAYLIPTIINLPLLFAFVLGVATASQQAALGLVLIGLIFAVTIFALASLSIGMTVDLFCIPMQVSKANDLIRRNILIDIARRVVPNCPDQLGANRAIFPRIVIAVGLSTLLLLPISLIAGVASMAGAVSTKVKQTEPQPRTTPTDNENNSTTSMDDATIEANDPTTTVRSDESVPSSNDQTAKDLPEPASQVFEGPISSPPVEKKSRKLDLANPFANSIPSTTTVRTEETPNRDESIPTERKTDEIPNPQSNESEQSQAPTRSSGF